MIKLTSKMTFWIFNIYKIKYIYIIQLQTFVEVNMSFYWPVK